MGILYSKNLKEIYLKSNVAKTIKAKYNKMYKHKGKRYNIKMFYNLLRSLVKLEMVNDKTGKIIKRVGSKTDLKNILIKVINRCAVIGVKVVKEVVKQAQKWLDSFEEVRKGVIDRNISVLSDLGVNIKGDNYNTILGVDFFHRS